MPDESVNSADIPIISLSVSAGINGFINIKSIKIVFQIIYLNLNYLQNTWLPI